MAEVLHKCSICSKAFVAQFSYQMEEHRAANGERGAAEFRFFCSQDCVTRSHTVSGLVPCDACGAAFTVTRPAEVCYLAGRRHYACTDACRQQLLRESRGARLGDELDAMAAEIRAAAGASPMASPPTTAPATPDPTASASPEMAGPDASPGSTAHGAPATRSARSAAATLVPTMRVAPRATAAASPATPATPTTSNVTAAGTPEATTGADSLTGPRVMAVFNHKGGTGKTTTAVTLASGLAARGYKTLLVDTDAQGNVAVSLGMNNLTRTLYHVLVMGCPLSDAVTTTRENLDVLVSNETLAAAELYLAGRQNRDRILAARLQSARHDYDYVVVDCSPSLSLLNQNALVFSDAVLCPVACDYLSLVGVRQVVKTIKNVNRLLNHPVQLWGVLPTMYDRRARICNEALETMREHFKERCLDPIRSAIRVKEAPSQGRTLFEYDADSSVSQDYGRLVDRVTRLGFQKQPYLASA